MSIVPVGGIASHVTTTGFAGGTDGQDPRAYSYRTMVPVDVVPLTAYSGLALTANPALHHLAATPASTLLVYEIAAVFEQT